MFSVCSGVFGVLGCFEFWGLVWGFDLGVWVCFAWVCLRCLMVLSAAVGLVLGLRCCYGWFEVLFSCSVWCLISLFAFRVLF